MPSFFLHIGIGFIFAEIILRVFNKDIEDRKNSRPLYLWLGFFGGLGPDLDFIPSIIQGVHFYTYHHTYTHTFLALGIIFAIVLITKFNPLALVFLAGWGMHMFADWFDNSITPFGPFLPTLEWGMLCGWGEIPGGSWASEYWLEPGYAYDHDLWSIFMGNGWGIPFMSEFLSYYDLAFIPFTLVFLIYLIYITISKARNRGK